MQLNDPRCVRWIYGGEYCLGLALVGAFWDLAKSIGNQAAAELFADFLFITDGQLDESVYAEVLVASDDDGDLGVLTGEQLAIRDAFVTIHGWSEDIDTTQSGVELSWQGPDSGPDEGTDFYVYYEVVPPTVVLKTTRKDDRDVRKWRIGRRDPVTLEPLDIGTITAEWTVTGPTQNLAIEVGTEAPVNTVNVVDVPREGPDKYVNLRFNVQNGIGGRAVAYGSSQGGGRMSGSIATFAFKLRSEGIGEDAQGAGELTVGTVLRSRFETIGSNERLVAGHLLSRNAESFMQPFLGERRHDRT